MLKLLTNTPFSGSISYSDFRVRSAGVLKFPFWVWVCDCSCKFFKTMVLSNENDSSALPKPTHFQGGLNMGSRKFGQEARHNRRALGVINKNLVGAQAYPCVVKKRLLPLNHTVTACEKKNQPDPVHRPITRKYAAQMASTKAASPQVQVRKADPIVSETNGFGDCIIVDVEEEDNENPVPMEEVEMEDISVQEQEGVLDIDGSDARNVLAAVDYVTDIYAYYRKVECCSCVSPDYMEQQPEINEKMRAILIDWLIEVHDKFKLLKETLFLTVNLIDRFLSRQTVVRKKLQLVGLVAMLLACKYEEVCVPIVGDLIHISDRAYARDDILQMERLMLNTLQFNISLPTPYVFMQRFLKAAHNSKVTHSQELEILSYFLIELSLVEYEMLKYPPSLLAAAAIYTAQCTLNGPSSKQWNKTCEWHSSYSQDSLLECSRLMVGLHQKAPSGKLTGVHRKYCASKFSYTAKLEPALFLLP